MMEKTRWAKDLTIPAVKEAVGMDVGMDVVKGGAEEMVGKTGGGCSGTVLQCLLISFSNYI